jgi:hypothetical protein
VGSLDYVSGEVVYALHGGAADPSEAGWVQADFNQPIAEDMSLQTGPIARARIKVGPNATELASDTVLDVLNLSDQLVEASLRQGRIVLRLRDLQDSEKIEIEFPTGSLWLLKRAPTTSMPGAMIGRRGSPFWEAPRGSSTKIPISG